MILISNPKVAGFEPRWAPYRGFSLLFDNPRESVTPMGGDLLRADCSVDRNAELRLYRGFVQFLDQVDRHELTNQFLFCPLLPFSYHVTVWDGLNDGNVHGVSSKHRRRLERFLAKLPDSLLTDDEFTAELRDSPLVNRADWSIKFRFLELAQWGNLVIVARLVPADPGSKKTLKWIEEERKALSGMFRKRFGSEMHHPYNPHVTLGYFANEEDAALSVAHVDRWNESIKRQVADLTVTFSSVSLYGFTDMITFFKRKP